MRAVSPVGDRVLVKVAVAEQRTSGGILLPGSATKKPTQGEVTAAGTAKAVKVGSRRQSLAHSSMLLGRLPASPLQQSNAGS